MAIVVEDGTVVTGANSYVTEAELTAYAVARGITIASDPEELLIKSMDYVEGLIYQGYKYTSDQPLQWPRSAVILDGYYLDADEIPQLLKDGQMESALSVENDVDPLADIARQKKSATVGPVSVVYESGQSTTIVRKISNKLQKLLANGSLSSSTFTVDRG